MTVDLHPVDLAIVGLYLVVVVWIGLRLSKKHETAEEYFLAGRKLTWPFVGLSLYASNQSASSLVGMAAAGYATGVAVFNYEWSAILILVVFAVFFLPYYIRTGIYTMPEFLELRFDQRSRYYHSAITITGNLLIDTAGSLYASALIVSLVFPEVELWQSIAVIAGLTGLYTITGGLAAVVYTDAIQSVVLILGAIVVSVLTFQQAGSWAEITAALGEDRMSLIRPADDPYLPWPGLVLGIPLLGFYYWTTNQYIVQRALGARSVRDGQWGALLAGLLKVPVLFLMVLPGVAAVLLYPGLDNANEVFPRLMFDLLPTGVLGLVLAGVVAALMSSVDSALNSASTLATIDFYQKARPDADSEHLMWVGRGFTALFMVIAAVVAPQIERFPSLFDYLQQVLAYITPPIVASFVLGMFWKRATAAGSFAGLVAGGVLGIALFVAKVVLFPEALAPLHFLYVAFVLFAVAALTLVGVSLATAPPPAEKTEGHTWSGAAYREETRALADLPWYKNYRVQSVALIALTLAVVVAFW